MTASTSIARHGGHGCYDIIESLVPGRSKFKFDESISQATVDSSRLVRVNCVIRKPHSLSLLTTRSPKSTVVRDNNNLGFNPSATTTRRIPSGGSLNTSETKWNFVCRFACGCIYQMDFSLYRAQQEPKFASLWYFIGSLIVLAFTFRAA